jgi:hypothetical protein
VIDESSNFFDFEIDEKWANFRTKYPDRPFCLLQPQDPIVGIPYLHIPAGFSRKTTFSVVRRDDVNPAGPSDWASICGITSATGIDFVALFVDNSGSMYTSTVQESYDKFIDDLSALGLDFCTVENGSEDWITPFDAQMGTFNNITRQCETTGVVQGGAADADSIAALSQPSTSNQTTESPSTSNQTTGSPNMTPVDNPSQLLPTESPIMIPSGNPSHTPSSRPSALISSTEPTIEPSQELKPTFTMVPTTMEPVKTPSPAQSKAPKATPSPSESTTPKATPSPSQGTASKATPSPTMPKATANPTVNPSPDPAMTRL